MLISHPNFKNFIIATVLMVAILFSVTLLLVYNVFGQSTSLTPGTVFKANTAGSIEFYYASDNKRHAFPNDATFYTWYADKSKVVTLDSSVVAATVLGVNVTYRPGVKMIKTASDPKIYVVDAGKKIHPLASNQVAADIYGSNWNSMIDVIPDNFFVNYTISSTTITDASQYDKEAVKNAATSINVDLGLGEIPALNPCNIHTLSCTDTDGGNNPDIRGTVTDNQGIISTDQCHTDSRYLGKLEEYFCSDFGGTNMWTIDCANGCQSGACILPITISNVSVYNLTDQLAGISWTTNKLGDSQIRYATSSSALENTMWDIQPQTRTSHDRTIANLIPGTKYYYEIRSLDVGISGETYQGSFTTLASDPQCPSGTVLGISRASCAWDCETYWGNSCNSTPLEDTTIDLCDWTYCIPFTLSFLRPGTGEVVTDTTTYTGPMTGGFDFNLDATAFLNSTSTNETLSMVVIYNGQEITAASSNLDLMSFTTLAGNPGEFKKRLTIKSKALTQGDHPFTFRATNSAGQTTEKIIIVKRVVPTTSGGCSISPVAPPSYTSWLNLLLYSLLPLFGLYVSKKILVSEYKR